MPDLKQLAPYLPCTACFLAGALIAFPLGWFGQDSPESAIIHRADHVEFTDNLLAEYIREARSLRHAGTARNLPTPGKMQGRTADGNQQGG